LRQVIQRFQTYATYWERILKQREDGVYHKDLFKAEMREKLQRDTDRSNSAQARAEKGLHELFSSYTTALKQSGNGAANIDYDQFKRKMVERAKALKTTH